jgi:hypothetical protein
VEYAPHNLLTYSEQFDNAAWTKYNFTVTANSIAAPNGTITADKAVPSTDNNLHHLYSSATVSYGVKYTISAYAKSSGYNYLDLGLIYNATYYAGAQFNLNTGVIVRSGAGVDSTIENVTITSVGNGWYRCSATVTAGVAGMVSNASASNVEWISGAFHDASFSGDGTSGIYLWGAQLSVGPYPLDYTPTTSAAVYGPRFDYNPVTLAARGLLVEEQRSNLLTYSEQFDNAAWTKNFLSVTANSLSAPDGTVTADKLVDTAANDLHRVISSSFSSGTYTISVYAKAGERTKIEIVTQPVDAKFDLSNGTVISGTGASIVSVGNGWYRCVLTFTQSISSSVGYGLLDASGNRTYTGDGTSGAYLWGAQLEAGSFATSYIPTVAASVTRSADVASVNTLSPWFNATEGTLFAEYDTSIASGGPYQAELNDGTANNRITLYVSAGAQRTYVATSGAAQVDIGVGSISNNVVYKTAVAYKANDFAITVNGVSPTTDTSATIPTVNKLVLGAYNSDSLANLLNGHLRRIAYYPRRLTNAELQSITS